MKSRAYLIEGSRWVCNSGRSKEIIAVGRRAVFYRNVFSGFETYLEIDKFLEHHTPYTPEPKKEWLYECIDNAGVTVWRSGGGGTPDFYNKELRGKRFEYLKRKTGRKALLNLDTFEIEEVRDE